MIYLQALSLLCYLSLLVSAVLQPPTNLKLTSENFKHILTWQEPNNISMIYYNVEFQEDHGPFQLVSNCSNITSRHCDLTKVFTSLWRFYSARVQSFTSKDKSSPSEPIPDFEIFDTLVGPPVVEVVATEGGIEVSIQLPTSYLWDVKEQRSVSMLVAFPAIDYEIYLQPSSGVPIDLKAVNKESVTQFIQLMPNTNYCVSVHMDSENINRSVPSPMKCVITKGPQLKDDGRVHWLILGVVILIILPLVLIVLDRAGYISKKKIFTPNVLKSLPKNNELGSAMFMIPLDIVRNLQYGSCENLPRQVDHTPYFARNLCNLPIDQQAFPELDIASPEDPSELSTAPLLNCGSVLSEDLSVPFPLSLNDCTSIKNPLVNLVPHESMEASPEEIVFGSAASWNPLSKNPNGFPPLSPSLNRNRNIHVDLNSVCLADSDLWTGSLKAMSPNKDLNILDSLQTNDLVDIRQFPVLSGVNGLSMDNQDENDEDGVINGDGLNAPIISEYILR